LHRCTTYNYSFPASRDQFKGIYMSSTRIAKHLEVSNIFLDILSTFVEKIFML